MPFAPPAPDELVDEFSPPSPDDLVEEKPLVDSRSAGMIGGLGPPAPAGTVSQIANIPSVASQAIGELAAGTARTVRDVLNPLTYAPEQRERRFRITPEEIRMETPAEELAREPIQAGKPLFTPQGTGLQPEGNELERLVSRWSTPEGLVQIPLLQTRAGYLLLANMVPGLVGQIKDAVQGKGNEDEKRDRITDLVAQAALVAEGSMRRAPGFNPAVGLARELSKAELEPVDRGVVPIERQAVRFVPPPPETEVIEPAPPVPEAKAEPAPPVEGGLTFAGMPAKEIGSRSFPDTGTREYDITQGDTTAKIISYTDKIEIQSIRTREEARGKGSATAVIDKLKQEADRKGIPITGALGPEVSPEFWKNRGFSVDEEGQIKYPPPPAKAPTPSDVPPEQISDSSIKVGDTIQWEPSEKERRYQSPVEGIVQDVIHNQVGDIGFNIFSPTPNDPSNVVRVWSNRGKVVSRKPAKVEERESGVSSERQGGGIEPGVPSSSGTAMRPPTVVEIADEIAARGVDPQASYGQFVKARDLKPEISAKEWLPIYRQSLELANLNKKIAIAKQQPTSTIEPASYSRTRAESSLPPSSTPVAKLSQEVQKVARTEGQRSAKELPKGASIAQKEEAYGDLVRDKILNSPSFPKLLSAAKAFQKSLGRQLRSDWEESVRREPWDLLSAHAGVMNAKSARAKTLRALSDAVIKEADLPMEKPGTYRGMEYRIDWDKLAQQSMAGPGSPSATQGPDVWPPPAPSTGKGSEISKVLSQNPNGTWKVELTDGSIATWDGEFLYRGKGSKTNVMPAIETGEEMTGMGGAVPSEFDQPNTYVSNMFAAIDRDRVAMGKPPMPDTVRRTWDEDNQHALAQMNRNPDWIPDLIQEVLKRPRPLLSWENAGLVWHRAKLKAEYNNALQRVAQAFDDKRADDLAAAKTDAATFEDKLEELDRAVGRNGTGSEAGRTLQAQKMGAGDDFTLVEMTLRKRAAVGGRKLTPDETSAIKKQVDELNRVNAELVKSLSERDAKLAKAEADRAMAEIRAQNVPAFDKRVLAAAERIVSRLETAGDAAAQRLKARLANLGTSPDPQIVSDAAIWASGKIARLGLDLAKTTDALVSEFSEKIRPFAQAIWEQANRLIDAASADAPEVVQRAVKKADLVGQKEDFVSTVKTLVEKKEKQKITYYVQKLAREIYKNGITDREDMVDALHAELQKAIPEITRRQTMDAFSGYGDYKRLSKEKITVDLRGMKGELQQIAKLEDMARGTPPLKSGVERRTPTDAERQLIKLVNDAKNKFQVPVSNPEIQLKSALDTLKTSLTNRIKDYADRLARKDYAPRPRREIVMDVAANRLKAQAEAIKKRFREELINDRLKNRNKWEKLLDWGTKIRRFDVLSSPVVIPKLISAGIQRLTSMPAEEAIGGIYAKLPAYRAISEKAPLEGGGPNLRAEMTGYSSAFTKGMKDAYDVLKRGHSDLDVLYGKAGESYTGEFEFVSKLLALPGRLHGMIKAPVKRATFERAVQRYADYYARQGLDVNDEVVMTRIALDAYKAANRSIFLQDNRVVSGFNAAVRTWEQREKATGHATAGGKALATTARVVFPIVKVPVNIVAETLQYTTGLVTGNVKLGFAFKRGIDKLQPEQADLIMRELKKGSIGAAVLALGYFNADNIGGYYQPNQKKKPGEPKWGAINVFGVGVPSYLLHNPLLETLQVGATIRHVADSRLRKKDVTAQGLGAGAFAAALGVIEQVPFMREMAEVEKLRNPYTRGQFLGEQAKSLTVPAIVQRAAEWTDPNRRRPQTVVEHIKAGIPGLRQQVPVDTRK